MDNDKKRNVIECCVFTSHGITPVLSIPLKDHLKTLVVEDIQNDLNQVDKDSFEDSL